jgi:hypothetical protein
VSAKGVKRICPSCGGRKDFYAKTCHACREKPPGHPGLRGPDHPAWKGGFQIDRDGYVRTYAPDHPFPRKGGYVLEHVRVVELSLGRRMARSEVVHHIDHDRRNNALHNLEVMRAGEHSREHRLHDTVNRQRDANGRFAGNGGVECPKS